MVVGALSWCGARFGVWMLKRDESRAPVEGVVVAYAIPGSGETDGKRFSGKDEAVGGEAGVGEGVPHFS